MTAATAVAAGDHRCPAPGCHEQVPVERLACPRHWRLVSRPTRNRVWTAYKYGTPAQHLADVDEDEDIDAAILAGRR